MKLTTQNLLTEDHYFDGSKSFKPYFLFLSREVVVLSIGFFVSFMSCQLMVFTATIAFPHSLSSIFSHFVDQTSSLPFVSNELKDNKQSEDWDQVRLINATQCRMKRFKTSSNEIYYCLRLILCRSVHADCWLRSQKSDSIILYFRLFSLREQLQILASYLHRFPNSIQLASSWKGRDWW